MKQLYITICLGSLIGILTTFFIKTLYFIEAQHAIWNSESWPVHVLGLPLVLIFLFFLKRRTLYFPVKASELAAWKSESCLHWSVWMTPFQLIGTLLSHLVGASIGRESIAVLMSAGIVRAFQLEWRFWGPIAMGCGFSAILGNLWIGLVFVAELFSTEMNQKVYILISSYFACLLIQTLQVPHLIPAIEIADNFGFFQKLSFIFILSVCVGFTMRFYKWSYIHLSSFFKTKGIWFQFLSTIVLAGILMVPEFRKFQSLGLSQIENLNEIQLGFQVPFFKLIITLFSLVLGFWGGEFIPLVYTGLHFGATLAHSMDFNQLVGAYLACYLFFGAATRLKWTVSFLAFSLMGWSWALWILVLVNLTVGFSGDKSLYRSLE